MIEVGEGKKVPEIRFAGFTNAWEQRKLGDIMNITSVKRIHQSDWTDSGIRFLRARDIVSASKNEEPDDYLYISKEKYDEYSLVSGKVAIGDLLVTGVGTIGVPYLIRNSEPLYFKDGNIIWFQNGTKIDGYFFLYSFFGKAIQDFINESAGIGTVGTYTIESGKKTPISLPEMKEQQQIGAYFRNLDNLITLHQRKHEKLVIIKKAMLEKMFPQNGSNVPEIRFAGFTGPWEQRKFEDIAVRSSTISSERGLPRIEYEDIVSGTGCLNKDVFAKKCDKAGIVFRKGDVLYGKLRPYLQNWLLPSFNGLAVGDFWVLQPQNADGSFLYRLIQSRQFDEVANQSTGTKMPRADWKLVSKTEFFIPNTIDEQAAIGTFFEQIDSLITLHQRKYETLKRVKAALLQKMFV
ncbi:restriction endonuclease subunit S [Pseudoflavonifractor phocaeensis]|uniref:restriction endonuclease subunit S n=1 Tax=Pseudoflavonifractor phocaeensis TaxID=1870988 RepID=UPI0019588058